MLKHTLLVFSGVTAILFSCSTSQSPKSSSVASDPYIIKVGNKPVTTAEFRYVYNKNNVNQADAYSDKSIREYLDLYVKFRLKVREAEELGLDTTKEFKNELNGYKKQLASPYLTEKSVTERLIKEAYLRLNEEVKASHILIKVGPDAEPKDTLAAYNRIMDVRKKVMAGESFETLAKSYSEDPSAQTNSGNIGYFTSLQMVYPFEEGAYKTKIGEISMPVRTRFGYHLIKVQDRRMAKGEIKVSHIMVRYSAGANPEDSIAAVKKVNEIYSKLMRGEKWETLCAEFSDDMNSRNKGGELPPFTTGNMIPSFEEASFRLNNIGDISKPIQTQYGFHIIKLNEKKGIQKFEDMEASLKAKVAKDSRSDLSKTYLISRLKRENGLVENAKTLEYVSSVADSNLVTGKFNFDAAKKENTQTLFTIGAKKYTVNEFFTYVKAKQKAKSGFSSKHYMNLLYKDYLNETLVSYEEANLDKKYVDYRMLVKEYRDGILLFQLMDSKVWSKAIEDTAGLRKYYSENKENYKWGKRCQATIYNCKDQATLDLVRPQINNKYFDVASERGSKLVYGKGKSDIPASSKKAVDEIKSILSRDPNFVVEISAGSDVVESKGVKIFYSKERIKKFIKYLVTIGVDTNRVLKVDLGIVKAGPDKKADNKVLTFKYLSTSITTVEKYLNMSAPLTLQIKEGKFQAGDDAVLDSFEWKVGENIFEKNGRSYLVNIKTIMEPQLKTFEEAKGLIISDYQNFLEKEWISNLRAKYKVELNEPEIKALVKK